MCRWLFQVMKLNEKLETNEHDDILGTQIFSRVDPSQKLELIKYFQDKGEIVAMTGDGINDAPATEKGQYWYCYGKKGNPGGSGGFRYGIER